MISESKWEEAKAYLDLMITAYQVIGFAGAFGQGLDLMPLKKRYDSGERTQELYDSIMIQYGTFRACVGREIR